MEKLIIIKYGELGTKKGNIGYFLSLLKKNVIWQLKGIDSHVTFDIGRMFVETSNFDECIKRLQNVFGIHEMTIAYKIGNDIDDIKKNVLELVKNKEFKTFKINTKRSNKNYPIKSMEMNDILGGLILKNIDKVTVDVHNPELEITVEIRSNYTYIYFENIKGIGGYPVGAQGKGMLMLSGGIDSPVAGYLGIKRGIKIEALYFEAPPHTSLEARNKVISLTRKLAQYNNDVKLHIINFTEIEESIYRNIPKEYLITIMRRMMYRIAAKMAYRNNCKAIINGESIGQVASQTLTSMSVINEVVNIPVIRPVACFDKLEIIDMAQKIDTYETSILPYEDCCTIFVPEHPVINPKLDLAQEYEKLIPYEDMISKAIKSEEVIKVTPIEENKYEDLL